MLPTSTAVIFTCDTDARTAGRAEIQPRIAETASPHAGDLGSQHPGSAKLPHQVDVVVALLIVRRTAAFGVVRRTSLIIDLLPPGRPTGPRDAGQGRGVRGFTAA